MPIQFNNVMRKNDWIKLGIILVVGISAIILLYSEYKKTSYELEKSMSQTFLDLKEFYR